MDELSGASIAESAEWTAELFADVRVVGDPMHCALESLEWFARESWRSSQMVEKLPAWFALGMVERDEDVVEIEIAPRPIIDCVSTLLRGELIVIGSGAPQVDRAIATTRAAIAQEPERNLRSGKEARHEENECRQAKGDGGEQTRGGGDEHDGNISEKARAANTEILLPVSSAIRRSAHVGPAPSGRRADGSRFVIVSVVRSDGYLCDHSAAFLTAQSSA